MWLLSAEKSIPSMTAPGVISLDRLKYPGLRYYIVDSS